MVLPPEIGKAAETESLEPEEVLHSPDKGELHGDLLGGILDILVKDLEIERITEILAVKEIVKTCQESILDVIAVVDTAVVLGLEAESAEFGVLPEIEATGDFHVSSAGRFHLSVSVLSIEIMVDEEEGVSPIVSIESLEGSGYMMTVAAEIIEDLEVGLGGHNLPETEGQNGSRKDEFFGHNIDG
jgi:hypothetical protein